MKSYRCDDWSRLAGVEVEVRIFGQLFRAGTVDAVMPDGTVLWVAADHNGSRTLFEAVEGYEMWTDQYDMTVDLHSSLLCQQLQNHADS